MKKTSGQPEDLPARIDKLEARLAEQDHALLELSDELYRQQRQIAAQEQLISELRVRLEQVREHAQVPDDPRHEIPPHY
jgi:uncharacterized coiled-coil protein SlyX